MTKMVKKNSSYDQNSIMCACFLYNEATELGSKEVSQVSSTKIYSFVKKYIYKVLWNQYRTIMSNTQLRDDLLQDIWEKVFSEIKKYDPKKGMITTFIDPWIRHVVTNYSCKNITNTSPYYANAIKKVEEAGNRCKMEGIASDFKTLSHYSGLPIATVKNALKVAQRKDMLSFETSVSEEEYIERVKGPEEIVMMAETNRILDGILNKTLNDFEKNVLTLILNPRDPEKKHASYREVSEQLGSNISKIKRTLSRIVAKLEQDSTFASHYSYVFKSRSALEKDDLPILGDEDDGLEEEFQDFVAQMRT